MRQRLRFRLRVRVFVVWCFVLPTISGCGVFKSMKRSEVQRDEQVRTLQAREMAELERLDANIPVSYIESIETASGMRIVLRDSIPDPGDRMQDEDEAKEPSILITYEREEERRDSSVTESEVDTRVESERSVQVETGLPWLTWLLAGLVVGLALVVAVFLFFKFKV